MTDLQVVISHDTQERDDGVQDRKTAKRWRHVARALLEDEVLERPFIILLPHSAATIPRVFIVRGLASYLEDEEKVLFLFFSVFITACKTKDFNSTKPFVAYLLCTILRESVLKKCSTFSKCCFAGFFNFGFNVL